MFKEDYLDGGKLILKQAWAEMIDSIRFSIGHELSHENAKKELSAALSSAVSKRLPDEKFGILFSGGLDSSIIALLAKKSGKKFICYTLGFKDEDTKQPEDVEAAENAAKMLGVELKTIMLDTKQSEELIKKTVKILGSNLNNVVNVGVASVVLGCVEQAKKDNINIFFSGLGSEELFAGYDRHRKADDKQEECWNGLIGMYERDLLRDYAVASSTKVLFMTPFLGKELISIAMRVPAKLKINEEHSKLILREISEELGLPKQIAWRQKRAAQYGSRMSKAIDKLSRQNKFEFKKDYLKSLE